MELSIRVQKLGCGRVLARVEPSGPVVEADTEETAIQFVKQAHQVYLRSQHAWFRPEEKTAKVITYVVTR